jgi:hypothetical protein
MNDDKRDLIGSLLNDVLKAWHKVAFPPSSYAADIDFALIHFSPERVLAFVEFSKIGSRVTETQKVLYSALEKVAPVYLVGVSYRVEEKHHHDDTCYFKIGDWDGMSCFTFPSKGNMMTFVFEMFRIQRWGTNEIEYRTPKEFVEWELKLRGV